MTTSAARELANAITAYGDYVNISYDNLEWEYSKLEALLTAALKRCRNEALEEAADVSVELYRDGKDNGHWAVQKAIRELKEAE